MSRSGYSGDINNWDLIRWRGAVASAIRGKRGQAFFKEMLAALDKMESKRLIAEDLVKDGEVCALGAVGAARGVDMSKIDPQDHETVADTFGIPHALACEIMWINDDWRHEPPEARYIRVRAWLESTIKVPQP